ncbi:hypothetical protein PR048_014246 [Dryococelus australis]|uniref:Uncharacterized protein n=1 Tax=Dryococelus australis TaxID=614101 RepID=A0ABQ9HDP4_9NEOP|nr:hypothetical protein PR048_014246 [Dryococelus australis]
MALLSGFSRGSLVSPSLSLRCRSTLTSISLIGSQDLAVKSRSNIFTLHSLATAALMSPSITEYFRSVVGMLTETSRHFSCQEFGNAINRALAHTVFEPPGERCPIVAFHCAVDIGIFVRTSVGSSRQSREQLFRIKMFLWEATMVLYPYLIDTKIASGDREILYTSRQFASGDREILYTSRQFASGDREILYTSRQFARCKMPTRLTFREEYVQYILLHDDMGVSGLRRYFDVAPALTRNFSPPTYVNRVRSPAGSPPDFRYWLLDDVAGQRVFFSGISCFPRPYISALLHIHLTSSSSALKTSMLRATQISPWAFDWAIASAAAFHKSDPGLITGQDKQDIRVWDTWRTLPLAVGFSRGTPRKSSRVDTCQKLRLFALVLRATVNSLAELFCKLWLDRSLPTTVRRGSYLLRHGQCKHGLDRRPARNRMPSALMSIRRKPLEPVHLNPRCRNPSLLDVLAAAVPGTHLSCPFLRGRPLADVSMASGPATNLALAYRCRRFTTPVYTLSENASRMTNPAVTHVCGIDDSTTTPAPHVVVPPTSVLVTNALGPFLVTTLHRVETCQDVPPLHRMPFRAPTFLQFPGNNKAGGEVPSPSNINLFTDQFSRWVRRISIHLLKCKSWRIIYKSKIAGGNPPSHTRRSWTYKAPDLTQRYTLANITGSTPSPHRRFFAPRVLLREKEGDDHTFLAKPTQINNSYKAWSDFSTDSLIAACVSTTGYPITIGKPAMPPLPQLLVMLLDHCASHKERTRSNCIGLGQIKRCSSSGVELNQWRLFHRRKMSMEQRRNARVGVKGISPEKTRRPAASSGTSPTCENPGATSPGNEPGSSTWEAINLTPLDSIRGRLRKFSIFPALAVVTSCPSARVVGGCEAGKHEVHPLFAVLGDGPTGPVRWCVELCAAKNNQCGIIVKVIGPLEARCVPVTVMEFSNSEPLLHPTFLLHTRDSTIHLYAV